VTTGRIAFVVASDRNGAIGKDGTLPWRLPDDLKHVRALTVGKPLVVGRRTYESFPRRPLPDRTNIVLTRDPGYRADGALVAHSKDEAVALAADAPEIIVFGGAEIFRLFEADVERIYLTSVDAAVDGDTFYKLPGNWRIVEREDHGSDDRHPYAFTFFTLDRIRA
jgi:dihydrofolate reductase